MKVYPPWFGFQNTFQFADILYPPHLAVSGDRSLSAAIGGYSSLVGGCSSLVGGYSSLVGGCLPRSVAVGRCSSPPPLFVASAAVSGSRCPTTPPSTYPSLLPHLLLLPPILPPTLFPPPPSFPGWGAHGGL